MRSKKIPKQFKKLEISPKQDSKPYSYARICYKNISDEIKIQNKKHYSFDKNSGQMCVCVRACVLSRVSDSLQPHGL